MDAPFDRITAFLFCMGPRKKACRQYWTPDFSRWNHLSESYTRWNAASINVSKRSTVVHHMIAWLVYIIYISDISDFCASVSGRIKPWL